MIHIHSRIGAPPGTLITHSVCPGCHYPYCVGLGIYQNRRVADTILCSRQVARFTESQRQTHFLPTFATVYATAQAYVYMFLQINAAIVTYIIYTQQCPLIGSYQSRNAEGCRTVVTGMTYSYSYPMSYIFR